MTLTPDERRLKFEQYLTPAWAAELLVAQVGIKPGENVVEPSCGRGAFLKAIPAEVENVVGIEIDAELAQEAVANSGRPVIVGDFRTVPLPFKPSLFVGNPPFSRKAVDGFLKRAHADLDEGGRVAFILPAYHFQWARPTLEWADLFSINQMMIPRELFPGLTKPLNWVVFTKERVRRMFGFMLYHETRETNSLSPQAKLILVHGKPRKSTWRAVVDAALEAAGGAAHLEKIYDYAAGRRPTENPAWKEQIRKVLQLGGYEAQGDGNWAIAA